MIGAYVHRVFWQLELRQEAKRGGHAIMRLFYAQTLINKSRACVSGASCRFSRPSYATPMLPALTASIRRAGTDAPGRQTIGYLHDVLAPIADHPTNRIGEVLPWNMAKPVTNSDRTLTFNILNEAIQRSAFAALRDD
jgi:hypothetical protein